MTDVTGPDVDDETKMFLSSHPMAPAAAVDASLDVRIIDATLRCVARWGVAKTTLDDVAREAGCGRATIYRTFAGGKAALLNAVVQRETARLLAAVDGAAGAAATLEDVVVAGAVAASRFLVGHEPLRFLLEHEPDAVLPLVAFDRLRDLFTIAARAAQPHLARFLPDEETARAAEWVVRAVLSYSLNPVEGVELTEEDGARRFLTTFVLPAITRVPTRS